MNIVSFCYYYIYMTKLWLCYKSGIIKFSFNQKQHFCNKIITMWKLSIFAAITFTWQNYDFFIILYLIMPVAFLWWTCDVALSWHCCNFVMTLWQWLFKEGLPCSLLKNLGVREYLSFVANYTKCFKDWYIFKFIKKGKMVFIMLFIYFTV